MTQGITLVNGPFTEKALKEIFDSIAEIASKMTISEEGKSYKYQGTFIFNNNNPEEAELRIIKSSIEPFDSGLSVPL